MSERTVRTKKWILAITGAVTIAGVGACIATQRIAHEPEATAPAATAHVTTASQQAPALAAATPQAHDHGAEAAVPRMTASEVRTAMEKGEVVVVDVRDAGSYSAGHIPGALHIPLRSVQGRVPSLPRGKTVVTYCT